MTPVVKICGLSTALTLDAALEAGADMVGFVFFPKSPRHIDFATARALGLQARGTGEDRRAQRRRRRRDLKAHRRRFVARPHAIARGRNAGAGEADRRALRSPNDEGDRGRRARRSRSGQGLRGGRRLTLLIDAKPPKDAALPGGNGRPFDWRLTREFHSRVPWLLSGGLDPENVATAIALSGARGVDISSGVESAPGVKDERKIRAFVAAARRAFARAPAGVT